MDGDRDLHLQQCFDKWTKEYKLPISVQLSDEKRYALLRKFVSTSSSVLDVGCGDREALFACNKEKAVALDFSMTALKKLKAKGFKGYLVLANVTSLPFKDKCFEKAICSEVIEHLPTLMRARACIKELERVSKSFMVTTPNKDSLQGWSDKQHPTLLNMRSIREVFADLPVEISTIDATYPIPHWHRQLVTRLYYKKRIPAFLRRVYSKLSLSKIFPKGETLRGTCIVAIHDSEKLNRHRIT